MLCPGCGQPLPASADRRGRPARYHDAACRQRARRARLVSARSDVLAELAVLESVTSELRRALLADQDTAAAVDRLAAAADTVTRRLRPTTLAAVTDTATPNATAPVGDVPPAPFTHTTTHTAAAVTEPVTKPARRSSTPPATESASAAACTGPVTRTVDLTETIAAGWTLVQHAGDAEASTWHLRHHDRTVGSVRREYDLGSNARGWDARTGAGYRQVPAFGALAAGRHTQLWRTRDLAAAGLSNATQKSRKKSR